MNRFAKFSTCAVILAATTAITGFAGTAHAEYGALDNNKVVQSRGGDYVVNSFGNCVRTKWEAAEGNPCAAPEPVVAQPAPAPVSPARQLLTSDRTVYFDFDKSDLTPEAQTKLNHMANVLKGDKEVVRANIVGYADRIGNVEYNQRLSEKRANTVASYLNQRGYLNTRVTKVRALGEQASQGSCEGVTPRTALIDCLAKDRKVTVEIDFYEQSPVVSR